MSLYNDKNVLDEYYRCLETIDSNYNLLKNARGGLPFYEEKLQEGRQLVSFEGFSDQEINNLPTVEFLETTNKQTKEHNYIL